MRLYLPLQQSLLTILNSTIMKGSIATIFILVLSLYHVDAFLCVLYPRAARAPVVQVSKSSDAPLTQPLTHADILWKLRPPPDTPAMRKLFLRLGANAIRLEAALRGVDPPFCLCPKGGQAILEAYYQGNQGEL